MKNFLKLIVISKALKDDYLDLYSSTLINKITVAHDGADVPDQLYLTSDKDSKLTKIGYVGYLYQGRGIDLIIKLAEKLADFEFNIIGGNKEDIRFWQSQSKHLKNLKFEGYVPNGELSSYYSKLDILLAPYQKKFMYQKVKCSRHQNGCHL